MENPGGQHAATSETKGFRERTPLKPAEARQRLKLRKEQRSPLQFSKADLMRQNTLNQQHERNQPLWCPEDSSVPPSVQMMLQLHQTQFHSKQSSFHSEPHFSAEQVMKCKHVSNI